MQFKVLFGTVISSEEVLDICRIFFNGDHLFTEYLDPKLLAYEFDHVQVAYDARPISCVALCQLPPDPKPCRSAIPE